MQCLELGATDFEILNLISDDSHCPNNLIKSKNSRTISKTRIEGVVKFERLSIKIRMREYFTLEGKGNAYSRTRIIKYFATEIYLLFGHEQSSHIYPAIFPPRVELRN